MITLTQKHPGAIDQGSTVAGAVAALDNLLSRQARGEIGLDLAVAKLRERLALLQSREE